MSDQKKAPMKRKMKYSTVQGKNTENQQKKRSKLDNETKINKSGG